MLKKTISLLVVLTLLPCLMSCGGGSSDDGEVPNNAISLTADPVEVGKGSPSLITATLSDEIGNKRNRPVTFEITINASGGVIESGDQVTDEQGTARAIYRSGDSGGTDVVRVRIPPYGDATVDIKVFDVDPVRQSLTISANPNQVEMDGVSTITATLTDQDGPIPGAVGSFSFISNQSGARLTAVDRSTDVNGKITASYRAGSRPGIDVIQASFPPSIAATVSITVDTPTATITVSPTSLPDAEQYVDYSTLISASGGTPPYTFSTASGSAMPPGVTLNSNGVVTGSASGMVPGSYSFVIQVEDSAGRIKLETITLTVNEPSSSLTITSTQLDDATIGVSYSDQLEATGGRPPYTWSLAAGSSLPAWLSIASNGVVSGTPPTGTTPGTVSFIVQVQDANGVSTTARITIDVQ